VGNEGKIKNQLPAKYRQVDISALRTGRRGKHHDLVQGIVHDDAEAGFSP